MLRSSNYLVEGNQLEGKSLTKKRKLYVAPKLQALGKIESLTNAISCTGFANKTGTDHDDVTSATSLVGDVICL